METNISNYDVFIVVTLTYDGRGSREVKKEVLNAEREIKLFR